MSRRFLALEKKLDKSKYYELEEAMVLVKELGTCKFDESVEVSVNLGVNPKHADQQVRFSVTFPHGIGKERRVLVFARGQKAQEATAAGADIVGDSDLVERILGGFLDFDVAIAQPEMMPQVSKLGKILGPRKLMPNPKASTVTNEIAQAVKEFKAGKVQLRCDSYGIIHTSIGKCSFSVDKLIDNFKALIVAIVRAKPQTVKGSYIKKITLSTTMSPSVKVTTSCIYKIMESAR